MFDALVPPLTVLVVILAIFLVIRAFWLWYWKVNEVVDLLKDIRLCLRHMEWRGVRQTTDETPPAPEPSTKGR